MIFIVYTEEIDEVFVIHKFSHNCFADDTQVYLLRYTVTTHRVGAVALRFTNTELPG